MDYVVSGFEYASWGQLAAGGDCWQRTLCCDAVPGYGNLEVYASSLKYSYNPLSL
jgi:hypothetical protein